MKKLLLLVSMVIGFSANAQVQEIITSTQLEAYKNSLSYMSCVYSGKTKCYGANSLDEARATVTAMKKLTAGGVNSSKKASYDAMADELLLLITVDEAKAYISSLKNKSTVEVLNEYVDGSRFESTIIMPGENTLANAEKGIFDAEGMNEDSVSQTVVNSKEEMIAKAKENVTEDTEHYEHTPTFLEGVKFSEEASLDVTYQLLEGGKQVVQKTVSTNEYNGMSMKMTNTAEQLMRRIPDEGYAIKFVASKLESKQEIDPNVFDPAKKPVYEMKTDANLNVISAETRDEKWINRYVDIIEEEAERSRYDSNYLMLEYALDMVDKYDEKLKAADTDKKKAFYEKKKARYHENSKVYYDNLSEFADDEKVKAIKARYNSSAGGM